jgi:hypothetical protein
MACCGISVNVYVKSAAKRPYSKPEHREIKRCSNQTHHRCVYFEEDSFWCIWYILEMMLEVKDHRHVFSKKAICLSASGGLVRLRWGNQLSQFFTVAQYLGCVARLFIRFQIFYTSLNIGLRCDVMICPDLYLIWQNRKPSHDFSWQIVTSWCLKTKPHDF